ncbi:MAG: SGNH/GDSL hydrolase family protein [Clostridia bacterium]|nr:SGNH/GDSL hydrolase family protein [Clostridia bacterium]
MEPKTVYIGCIGDSITAGTGLREPAKEAFPAALEALLPNAAVYNFGNGGKTMRGDLGVDSYFNSVSYQDLMQNAARLNLVTVMLGTNDAYHAKGWTDTEIATFQSSCHTLFAALKAKNPDMRFVLMNSPACFGNKNDRYDMLPLRKLQSELVTDLNAAGYQTHFFDMYAVTKPLGEHFPDQLHPNKTAHRIMAEALCAYIQTII